MAFVYSSVDGFKKGIKNISNGHKHSVHFEDNIGKGYVKIRREKYKFTSNPMGINKNRTVYEMNDRDYAVICGAFKEEDIRIEMEQEDFKICKAVFKDEPYTRFWFEKGKFIIDTDNLIYKNAKSPSELLIMWSNIHSNK